MCEENLFITYLVLKNVKERFPQVKTYLWTGYYYEQLKKMTNPKVSLILDLLDVLIDGPYIEERRDITLSMRGSSNQSVIYLKEINNEQCDQCSTD